MSPAPRTHRAAPLGRNIGLERALVALFGFLALATGAAALALGQGWLGTGRSQRPVLDPVVTSWVAMTPRITAALVIVGGIVLLILGLWWLVHTLRPEKKPDARLDHGPSGEAVVTAGAITRAVRTDAETVAGVTRARARMTGNARRPGLRLKLSMADGTDVRQVWRDLDTGVLARARKTLGHDPMPTAVELDLERVPSPRVE